MANHSGLTQLLRAHGLCPDEVVEFFHRSGGPGGQHVNKVETGVTLVHRPTGERVRVEETRSRQRNRELAAERLRARLQERHAGRQQAAKAAAAKLRRQAARRSQASKAKMVEEKLHRGEIKRMRRKPATE